MKRGKPEKRKEKKENQLHNSHAFILRFIFMFIHVCDFKNMLFSKKITLLFVGARKINIVKVIELHYNFIFFRFYIIIKSIKTTSLFVSKSMFLEFVGHPFRRWFPQTLSEMLSKKPCTKLIKYSFLLQI